MLDTLADYADEARGGDSRLVLVAGEAGIGKTTLLQALGERVEHTCWLTGACDGAFTPLPLGPLFDVAAQVGGRFADSCRNGTPREVMFRGLLDELTASTDLTVLVIEDLHWADEATLDLVRFLARRLRHAPVLVLLSYRDDGLRPDHPLRATIGELATSRSVRRMGLPPLTPDAVRRLAHGSGVEASRLYALTSGNPFLVTEVLASGTEQVPPSAREAVLARVARLSAPARQVLEAAAVIGMRVEVEVLCAVSGAATAAIDECLTSGALVSDDRVFRFRHELARRAVEESIPAHRAAELHRLALDALLDLHRDEHARIAYHADHIADAVTVLQHAPLAAARASSLGAHTEALAHYQCAVRYAEHADLAERARLYVGLADEAVYIDRWPESAAARQTAIDLYTEIGDLPSLGTQWRRMVAAQWRLCNGERCSAAAYNAVGILEPLGPSPELAGAYASLSSLLVDSAPLAAMDVVEKTLVLAQQFDQPEFACVALQVRAVLRMDDGDHGFADLERALDIARSANDSKTMGSVFANAHEFAVRAHRFGLAQRYFDEGIEFTQDHEIDTYTSCLVGWRAAAMDKQGRYDEALSLLVDVLARRHVSPANRLYTMPTLARVRARRGDVEAKAALDEATDLVTGNGEPPLLLMVAVTRAEMAWLDGRTVDAAVAIREALAQLPAVDAWDRGLAVTWARRLGVDPPDDVAVAPPYELQLAGDHRGAADAWLTLGCPYDAALALYDSRQPDALREAAEILDRIGATVTLGLVRTRMREQGLRGVPRGARADTRANPFGLTRREREVLRLLCTGMTNAEIAADLVLAEKTVDHHVSSVLAKMGVSSRRQAARKAADAGLVGSLI